MRPPAELTISQGETAELIAGHFQELRPVRLRMLGEGWDNVAWLVNEEFVFRLPRRQMGADCLQGELTVLPHLAGRFPVPIPELLFIGEPCQEFPWPFAGYRFLPGTPADELRLNAAARRPLATSLGNLLRILHSIPISEVQSWETPTDTLGRMDIARRAEGARRMLAEAESLGLLSDTHRWESILGKAENLGNESRDLCLVHGDLYSKHLLVQSGELSGVIDWGDIHLGDPSGDLAVAVSFFAESERRVFFESYGAVSETSLALARLRAVNHSSACLLGSGDDEPFRAESLLALEQVLT